MAVSRQFHGQIKRALVWLMGIGPVIDPFRESRFSFSRIEPIESGEAGESFVSADEGCFVFRRKRG